MMEIKMMQYVKRLVCCLVVFSTFCYGQKNNTDKLREEIQSEDVRSFRFAKFASFYKKPKQELGFTDSQVLYVSNKKIWFHDDCARSITKKEEKDFDGRLYPLLKDAGSPKIFDVFLQKSFQQSKIKFIYDTKSITSDNNLCKLNDMVGFYEMEDGSFLIENGHFHHFLPTKGLVDVATIAPLEIKDLLGVRLTSLSLLDDENRNFYKRYGMDTGRNCDCSYYDIIIDQNQQDIYLVSRCESLKSSLKNFTGFKITKIENYDGGLRFFTKNKNNKQDRDPHPIRGDLVLTIRRGDGSIFLVKQDYDGVYRAGSPELYVDNKISHKFEKDDECF
jgi:hypothetical protein